MPLAFAALGQTNALLVGGFDISVGAVIVVVLVAASFLLTSTASDVELALGIAALIGIGVGVGVVNAALIKVFKLPSIIATLATLSVLQGVALALRPTPGGEIDFAITDALTRSVGFVPLGFVAIVVLAVAGDFWLYRTQSGLTARAVGLDETSARRIGAPATWIHVRAFVFSAVLAALGGLFLAAQFGVGTADPGVVSKFALTSIAAAVLGGASLAGGKGSFLGAVLGAVFLSLIVNILPFLGWSASLEQISIGALTLVALVVYQRADLWTRLRARVARRALPARS